MYSKLPNLLIGFHGCKKDICNRVLNGYDVLKESTNTYDWLGNGIYFWENNHERALLWAKQRHGEDAAFSLKESRFTKVRQSLERHTFNYVCAT